MHVRAITIAGLITTVFGTLSAGRLSAQPPGYEAITAARKLEQAGELKSAFLAFARISGAESKAIAMARPEAAVYLQLLDDHASELPTETVHLLRGDLLLALGKQSEALQSYRTAADLLKQGHRLTGKGYWVEPPREAVVYIGHQPVTPFQMGPGSHRDNWLIRRFIALKAWPDVRTEMERVWKIHQQNTQPYRTKLTFRNEFGLLVTEQRYVQPAGFNGQGLQFALDYAFFLKQQDELTAALEILGEPLFMINMDRNPNVVHYEDVPPGAENRLPLRDHAKQLARISPFGHYGGMSRKEYIRLTWGVSKDAGQAATLERTIRERIDGGDNHLRRVLARIYYHEGRVDDALAEELAYIESSDINQLSKTIRRGLVFEDASRTAEATDEYERALTLPLVSVDRPDAEEQMTQRSAQQAMPAISLPGGSAGLRSELFGRLIRLYGAQGNAVKAFELSLLQIEANPQTVVNVESLARVADRARAIRHEEKFNDWLRRWVNVTQAPLSKAAAFWILGEYRKCAELLATPDTLGYAYDQWHQRFSGVGEPQLRTFLEAILASDPTHARASLDWLELEQDFDSQRAAQALEALLEPNAPYAFARGKGVVNRTRFRNYFDLAYRLMRLYEKHGESEKLLALGLRVLRAEKPFERKSDTELRTPRANWNQRSPLEDLLECTYVVLPYLRESPHKIEIDTIIGESECIPLKNQWAKLTSLEPQRLDPSELNRRRYKQVDIQTLRLPDGVTILTHRDDVRAAGPEGEWIGTSWGLIRYQVTESNSLRITQIPLGFRVTSFLKTPAGFFVGTRGGLHRIDCPDEASPKVVRIDLHSVFQAVEGNRGRRIDSQQLLWSQNSLWVSDKLALFRYDPDKGSAQYFGRCSGHPFAAAGTIWCNVDYSTMACYDPHAEEFRKLSVVGERAQLIGNSGGEIWANVYLDNTRRHRPAIIDPQTLDVRVIPVSGTRTDEPLCINSAFRIVADDGRNVWMACGHAKVAKYDRDEDRLTVAERNYEPSTQHVGPMTWDAYQDGGQFYRLYCRSSSVERIPGLILDGDRGPYFCWREYDNDRLLLGAGIIRNWQEDNMGFDDSDGMSHHIQDLEGGLFEIDTKNLHWQKLGARNGELCDFYVKRIIIDEPDRRAYVCTNGGVSILSLPDLKPIGRITVSDGLPSNKVEDIVRIGDRLYMACELGDEDGGLAVMDTKTGFIRRRTTADGLKCNKIKRLRAEGTKLHVLYGTLYGVRARNTALADSVQAKGADERVRTFSSSIVDTETWTVTDGREVLPAATAPDESHQIPWLGGALLCDVTYGDKRLLGGTHGLLVVPADGTVAGDPGLPAVPVQVHRSLGQRQLAEARTVNIQRGLSPTELAKWLEHENPFVRAEAMARVWDEVRAGRTGYTTLLAEQIDDPCDAASATAVFLLSETPGKDAIEPLQRALKSRDLRYRAVAAVSLAERGVRPSIEIFREAWEEHVKLGNHPFGAFSSVGMQAGQQRVAFALAVNADRTAMEFFLQRPISTDNYEPRQQIFKRLGESLRKRPDLAHVLLTAYTQGRDAGPESNAGAARFAQEVFRHAGVAMLPQLHAGLRSPNRVVRSNAARACGAIGNASSIEPLIEALDLESGYSRASIVWALGVLKAESALEHLAGLYVDARNDERQRQGGGFRMAQAASQVNSQYESLSNLNAIRTDWNELIRPNMGAPIDPKQNEWLLTPQVILQAVRNIGPESSQVFYRKLAAESDPKARHEAAMRLGECAPSDRQLNEPILRNLLGDEQVSVQAAAAISLLLMGRKDMEPRIVAWLESSDRTAHYPVLEQLERVSDSRQLVFARAGIRKILKNTDRAWEINRRAERLLARIPHE